VRTNDLPDGSSWYSPEKDHIKQIQSFAILFKAHPELFVSVPEQKDDKTTTTPREDNIITDETITDNAVIGPVSGSGAESAVQEAATREPVTIEQSGWLHVGSSRPSSPSKPSNPLLPSGPAGSTDRNNLVDSANTDKADAGDKGPLKLVLLGSARHQEDLARVEELKGLARKLGIEVRDHSGRFLMASDCSIRASSFYIQPLYIHICVHFLKLHIHTLDISSVTFTRGAPC
jgi:hypothetical protein